MIDYQLPEALTYENKRLMCEGECCSLRGFVDGKLERAVNIIECKRINNAIEYNWGDTEGHSSSCYGSFKKLEEKIWCC